MAVVEREASLLEAAGPEADRAQRAPAPPPVPDASPALTLRPALALPLVAAAARHRRRRRAARPHRLRPGRPHRRRARQPRARGLPRLARGRRRPRAARRQEAAPAPGRPRLPGVAGPRRRLARADLGAVLDAPRRLRLRRRPRLARRRPRRDGHRRAERRLLEADGPPASSPRRPLKEPRKTPLIASRAAHGHVLSPSRSRDRRLVLELRQADLPGLHDADPGRHALPGVLARPHAGAHDGRTSTATRC